MPIDLLDYFQRQGVVFEQRTGTVYQAPCPFHAESKPSFTVYTRDSDSRGKEHFHCYGCEAHGDLVDAIAMLEYPHVSDRKEAASLAFRRAREYGANLETQKAYVPSPPKPRLPSQRETLALTLAWRHYLGLHCPESYRYLGPRGIRAPEQLGLGYCPNHPGAFRDLVWQLSAAIGEDWRQVAIDVGLIYRDGSERLRRRVFLPEIRDHTCKYFQARMIDPEGPDDRRYLNPPGFRKPLYGLGSLEVEPRHAPLPELFLLTEGPFDLLPFRQWGQPGVALLSNRLRDTAEIAERAKGRVVAVALDADGPGEEALPEVLAQLAAWNLRTLRFKPPEPLVQDGCKDLGDWVKRQGTRAVLRALRRAWEEAR